MKLIVGLGNPGKKYEKTRHNAGFMALDLLHKRLSSYQIQPWELSHKFNAYIAECMVEGGKIILMKPATFMNASGEALQMILHFYKLSPKDIIIVHDDKDIPLGEIKVQQDRGHAGHNGVRSIMEHLSTQVFTRIRIGIAGEPEKMGDVPTFVLKKFGLFEKKKLQEALTKTTDTIAALIP